MSDPSREHGPEPFERQHAIPAAGSEHRAASVTLREGAPEGEDPASLMDPANQSLADALKITFRLVQFAMVVVAILYLFSGFQPIRQDERGIRLLFGREQATDLPPGFGYSLPYPFGELIKVSIGLRDFTERQAFWPDLSEVSGAQSIENIPRKSKLDPTIDGAVITSDGNLAHTLWRVGYERVRPGDYVRNILPEDEERIVRAAVRRGVTQAVATVTVDQLLRQSSSEEGSVASRARRIAQDTLDSLGAGIEVKLLTLEQKIPPATLLSRFNAVEGAVSAAAQKQAEAQNEAQAILAHAAGTGARVLVRQIEAYEDAIDRADAPAQLRALERIEALLEGRTVEIDGMTYENAVSGEVTAIFNDARQFATEIVNRRRNEAMIFQARLQQFRENPALMVRRDVNEAYSAFASRETVQKLYIPPGTSTLELVLNADPDVSKQMYRAQKLIEAERARQQRELERKRQRFQTETGRVINQ